MSDPLKRITVHFNDKALKLTEAQKYYKLHDVMNHIFYLSSQEGHHRDTNWTYYPSVNPENMTFVFDCTKEIAEKLQKKFPDLKIEQGGTPYGVMMRESDRFRGQKPPQP